MTIVSPNQKYNSSGSGQTSIDIYLALAIGVNQRPHGEPA